MEKPIIIGICFIIAILLGFFLVYPKYQDLTILLKKSEQRKEELVHQEEYFSEINQLFEKLKDYEAETKKIDSALPEDPSLPALYDYLQAASSENGLVPASIEVGSPAKSETSPNIQELGISISVSGFYTALKNFISTLYKSARIIEVQTISFPSGQEKSIFDFNLQLKTHSYILVEPAAESMGEQAPPAEGVEIIPAI